MKRSLMGCSVASALAMLAAAPQAGAAGFALYEQGVSGLGNAYAGAAAAAEDATTVWWNPAGMARLGSGKHFAFAGALIVPSTEFSNRGSVPPGIRPLGGTGGDAGDAALVPSLFFAMDLNPRWNFGIGVSVPFGLKTEYDPSWLGRFQGIESEIKTLNINPSVSYKFSDVLSVGFGLNYQRLEIKTLTAVNFGLGEGQNRLDVEGDAWGFNAGVLFSVTPATRVGIHYRSSLDYEGVDGTTTFSGTPPVATLASGGAKLDVKTPDSLAFSVAHRLNDRWDLLGDVTWWNWSRISSVAVIRTDGALAGQPAGSFVFNFDDALRASIGANYRMNDAWTLKLGAAYDQTPVPSAESRTVRLPDSDRLWLSLGAKYQLSRNAALDLGYTFIKPRDADINNNQGTGATGAGNVVGTFDADVHILGIQYQHRF